jgi:hypothetical protein
MYVVLVYSAALNIRFTSQPVNKGTLTAYALHAFVTYFSQWQTLAAAL